MCSRFQRSVGVAALLVTHIALGTNLGRFFWGRNRGSPVGVLQRHGGGFTRDDLRYPHRHSRCRHAEASSRGGSVDTGFAGKLLHTRNVGLDVYSAQWESTPGYLASLFQVVNAAQVDKEIRLSGAILLKNLVARKWEVHSIRLIEQFRQATLQTR